MSVLQVLLLWSVVYAASELVRKHYAGRSLQYMFWKLSRSRIKVLKNLLAKVHLVWCNVLICKIPGWEGECIAEVRLQPPVRQISHSLAFD